MNMATTIEVGMQVAWLLSRRKGRSVMGQVVDVTNGGTRATVDINGTESGKDNDKCGTRWSVAVADLQIL